MQMNSSAHLKLRRARGAIHEPGVAESGLLLLLMQYSSFSNIFYTCVRACSGFLDGGIVCA